MIGNKQDWYSWQLKPCPQTYTLTSPAPAPREVPVLGIFNPITTASPPSYEKLPLTTESQDAAIAIPKGCHLTLTPVISSNSPLPSTSSPSSGPPPNQSYPIVVIPKLAIPAEAYLNHLNQPGGKGYLCHLCSF